MLTHIKCAVFIVRVMQSECCFLQFLSLVGQLSFRLVEPETFPFEPAETLDLTALLHAVQTHWVDQLLFCLPSLLDLRSCAAPWWVTFSRHPTAMVWICIAKRRRWLGEEMHGVWSRWSQTEEDYRGPWERLWKRTVKHANWIRRMLWIIVDRGSW